MIDLAIFFLIGSLLGWYLEDLIDAYFYWRDGTTVPAIELVEFTPEWERMQAELALVTRRAFVPREPGIDC